MNLHQATEHESCAKKVYLSGPTHHKTGCIGHWRGKTDYSKRSKQMNQQMFGMCAYNDPSNLFLITNRVEFMRDINPSLIPEGQISHKSLSKVLLNADTKRWSKCFAFIPIAEGVELEDYHRVNIFHIC